jgi:3-methylfumaryl-CoA hydratase
MEIPDYSAWLGRQEVLSDTITLAPARAMAATLNQDDRPLELGAPIPPLWTWLYFLPLTPSRDIGRDGHPRRGGFLPPVDLPRRMWAGSRLRFSRPVRIGATAERLSTIKRIESKQGRAGPLVFVTVLHETSIEGVLAICEEQDIVYIGIPDQFVAPPPIASPEIDWSEHHAIDAAFLFRFSALTFNAHRIHYDRDYARAVEHYPGLVIHGPLQALLLFHAASKRAPERTPAAFDFRGLRPLFDFENITLNGSDSLADDVRLCTATADGGLAMHARLTWEA